jgi:DNA-binding transcriptional ArsR family regulator
LAAKKMSRLKKPRGKTKTKPSRKKGSVVAQREAASGAIEQNIVKALAHPLRVRILTVLNDQVASPNELRKLLEEGLSQVSYHVKVLKDFEMIEMVKTEPRRGAVEHFYRATSKVFVPSWVAKAWPKSARDGVAGTIMEQVEVDLVESINAGLFNDRPDHVVARDPRTLDGKGREDAEVLAAEFFERYEKIGGEADERLKNGEGDGERIQTSAVLLVFTSLKGKNVNLNRER